MALAFDLPTLYATNEVIIEQYVNVSYVDFLFGQLQYLYSNVSDQIEC